jgi:hypothetical protein
MEPRRQHESLAVPPADGLPAAHWQPAITLAGSVVRWGAVAIAVLLLAWFSYTRAGWVPFLAGVDLGVHEFGHLLFWWAPSLVMSLAGSCLQVAAPAALAGYFWSRRDRVAVVLLTAWLGMSLHNVSVYIHDATRMALPLFGDDGSGAGHDWRNILGDVGWLAHTDTIAGLVRFSSLLVFAGALALGGWFAWQERRPIPSRTSGPGDEWSHLPRVAR